MSEYLDVVKALDNLGFEQKKKCGNGWNIFLHPEYPEITVMLEESVDFTTYSICQDGIPVSYHLDTKTELSGKGQKWKGVCNHIDYHANMETIDRQLAIIFDGVAHWGHIGFPVSPT